MVSTHSVFVLPVTRRRSRLPWASKPSDTLPRQRPWQCRWNLASVQTVPLACSKLTPRDAATPGIYTFRLHGWDQLGPEVDSLRDLMKAKGCSELLIYPRAWQG